MAEVTILEIAREIGAMGLLGVVLVWLLRKVSHSLDALTAQHRESSAINRILTEAIIQVLHKDDPDAATRLEENLRRELKNGKVN